MLRSIWTAAPASVLLGVALTGVGLLLHLEYVTYFAFIALSSAILLNWAISGAALVRILRGGTVRSYWQTLSVSAAAIAFLTLANYIKPASGV